MSIFPLVSEVVILRFRLFLCATRACHRCAGIQPVDLIIIYHYWFISPFFGTLSVAIITRNYDRATVLYAKRITEHRIRQVQSPVGVYTEAERVCSKPDKTRGHILMEYKMLETRNILFLRMWMSWMDGNLNVSIGELSHRQWRIEIYRWIKFPLFLFFIVVAFIHC